MPITGAKSALASKGVWGGLIAVAAGLAGLVGVDIGGQEAGELAEHAAAIAAAVGGIVAIWGRIAARRRIGRDD